MKIFAFLIPVFLSQEYSSYFYSVSLPDQPECNSNQRSICQKRGFQCFGKWNRWGGEIFECRKTVILLNKEFSYLFSAAKTVDAAQRLELNINLWVCLRTIPAEALLAPVSLFNRVIKNSILKIFFRIDGRQTSRKKTMLLQSWLRQ